MYYPVYQNEWAFFPEHDFLTQISLIRQSILFIDTTTVFFIFWYIHKCIVALCLFGWRNHIGRKR